MSDRTDGFPSSEAASPDDGANEAARDAPARAATTTDSLLAPAFRAAAASATPATVAASSAPPTAAPQATNFATASPRNAAPVAAGPRIELETTGDSAGARFERWLTRLGDRLNPILVKETRQAFKSRQFTVWFSLLLGLGWLWSFFGVIQIGPAIYDGAYGPDLFIGYYTLLSFCLLVVVPFVSFRSLSTEREDKTYDLLQITTLKPSQIISGKLGSAAAQILLYGSAIAPCLAFTYLLRGVPLLTMTIVMVYLALASMGLSMVGVFAATLAKHRSWQTVLSLLLIVGLLYAFGVGMIIVGEGLTRASMLTGNREFWLISAVAFTAYVAVFALLFAISVAEITFSADNRSTPGRVTTLFCQIAFAAWCGYGWMYEADRHPGMVALFVVGSLLFWYATGVVLGSEPSEPSRRVRRGLPTSFLGRVGLTWLYPGPSTGYVFTVANAGAIVALGFYVHGLSKPDSGGVHRPLPELMLALYAYLVIYLGLGNLLGAAVRRAWNVPHAPAMLINVMLVLAGMAAPNLLQWAFDPDFRSVWDYRVWHASNPLWTIQTLAEQRPLSNDAFWAFILLQIGAAAVFVLNVPGVVHEIRFTRTPPPKRVREDDAEQQPVVAAPAGPNSPWD